MSADSTTAVRSSLSMTLQPRVLFPALLGAGIVAAVVIEPLAALAVVGAFSFLFAYFYRRDRLLGAIFILLLFQNLAYIRILPSNDRLAYAVKHADDLLVVFFAVALAAETFLPTVRLNRVPLWRPFALFLAVCLVAAVYNRLSPRETAIGTYVLAKNFAWFFLAASLRLDDRTYRNIVWFLIAVLGAILAFGFFQLVTGDLTYDWLQLPKDYRYGIVRLRSIFVHPVFLAESMAFLAVLAVSAYVQMRRPVWLALAAGATAAVALTLLVKTLLALGLAVGFLFLRKRPWLIVPYGLAAIVAMVSFSEYGTRNIRTQFSTYVESPQSVRREGYRIAGEILGDSPAFGVGPGMFGGYAATVLDSPISGRYGFINYDQQDYSTIDAHWPHLAAEIGLVGFLIYVWLLRSAGLAAWRLANRKTVSPYARTLAMAAAVFLVVTVVEAFAAANLEDTLCGFMIFSLLGLTQGRMTEYVVPTALGQPQAATKKE